MQAQLEQAMKDPAVQVCLYVWMEDAAVERGCVCGARGEQQPILFLVKKKKKKKNDPTSSLILLSTLLLLLQAQMAEMQAVMSNSAVQERMAKLRTDPDLAPMFEDIQANGVAALMKYMNDPAWLAKVGSRMGDVSELLAAGGGGAGGPTAPGAASVPRPPVVETSVTDLFSAAKAGDLEAVEDFLAIGKDPGEADAAGRTPLHAAAAYDRLEAGAELIKAGAPLDAADGEGNTPLHYAAGYGRPRLVELLVRSGANGAAENAKGQTPIELVSGEPRNPINGLADVLAVLENAAMAGAEMTE
jgi:hypothetical protein